MNPFEHNTPSNVCAELMKFASQLVKKVVKVNGDLEGLLRDLGIDCSQITEEMTNNNLIKCWIGINGFGYTNSVYITKNGKWNSYYVPDNDNFIWITCIEYRPSFGYGCKWIVVEPKQILKEIKYHVEKEN